MTTETVALIFIVAFVVGAIFVMRGALRYKPGLGEGLRALDEKLARQATLIEWLYEQSLNQAQRINELERENALMRTEIEKLHHENAQLRAMNEYLSLSLRSFTSPAGLSTLREILTARLSETDLRTLAFDIGVSYENINGENLQTRIVELITYCERRGMIDKLMTRLRELRPDLIGSI